MERLAVCVSGEGTLLKAILEANISVSLVVADRICNALDIAKSHGVPIELIDRSFFKVNGRFNREGFTKAFENRIRNRDIGLVALAGFMTILGPEVFKFYENKIINTHPSLLPKFKGSHAVKDALEAGEPVTGFTLHYATEDLDAGPIITQVEVPILPNDTEESLHERIKTEEKKEYPEVLRKILG